MSFKDGAVSYQLKIVRYVWLSEEAALKDYEEVVSKFLKGINVWILIENIEIMLLLLNLHIKRMTSKTSKIKSLMFLFNVIKF